jgi:type I restriction enzyme, S subunit
MNNGWQTRQLGDLCDVLDYKRKPVTKRDRVAGEYPYYGATGVLDYVDGYLFDEPLVLVGEDGAKWESGENSAFAVTGKVWVNNHAHVLRPHRTKLLDNWLIYHLNHSDLTEFVSGLTVPKLNQSSLREIPIPLPPLPEQRRIVGILDEAFEGIATAKANAEKNLQNARALFESHLQSVFTQRGKGWVETTLGEVCEFIGGSQPPKSVFSKTKKADNIRLIQIRDYKSDNHVVYIPRTQARRFCNADDVMIGRYGPPLFQILRGLEGAYNVALMKAAPDESKLSRDFLFYFLRHSSILQYVIYHSERAAGQIGLTKETLEPYPIALPSLVDQQKVVETITKLEAETRRLAALYGRKLAALEALKKSLLHQAFTGQL